MIKNGNGVAKFVWVSKDPAVAFPALAPSTAGATLSVAAGDGDTATVTLGGGAWTRPSTSWPRGSTTASSVPPPSRR